MHKNRSTVPVERIESAILLIRGHKVMLDRDLAQLYGVPTKVFNQAVRRNRDRFPPDFMFRLSKQEFKNLRSQFGDLKFEIPICDIKFWVGRPTAPALRLYRAGRRDALKCSP